MSDRIKDGLSFLCGDNTMVLPKALHEIYVFGLAGSFDGSSRLLDARVPKSVTVVERLMLSSVASAQTVL